MSEAADRALRLAAWLLVGSLGCLLISQGLGLDPGPAVAAAQTLTPYAILGLVPLLALAVARQWWDVTAVGASVGLAGVALAFPLVFPPGQPDPMPGADGVQVAVVNLLFDNERIDDVADTLLELGADVLVFTEFTAEHQVALQGHPLAVAYPSRVERDGLGAGGTAVWSRLPLVPLETAEMVNYDVDVDVVAGDASFRLWAVHPPTPFHPRWHDDLKTVADRAGAIDAPLLVAGDFNSSYWHPAFRDVLRSGLTAAHIANGRGWSTSWPLDSPLPAFVRIDHALTNDELVSTDVTDFDVPGSDHRGFVVTVVPAA